MRAAHPDDGWVDRNLNRVRFAYADFDDGVRVGDTIALGSHRAYRLVAVTAVVPSRFFADYLPPQYAFAQNLTPAVNSTP